MIGIIYIIVLNYTISWYLNPLVRTDSTVELGTFLEIWGLPSIVGARAWLSAFPLFGSIFTVRLGGLGELAIEQGGVIQIFLFSMLASGSISGLIIDRVLRREIVIWVITFVASAFTYAYLWVNEFTVLFPASLFLGVVAGLVPVAWGAFFADNTSPEDRGKIMGLSVAASMPIAYIFLAYKPIGDSLRALFIAIVSIYLLAMLAININFPGNPENKRGRRRGRVEIELNFFYYAAPIFLFYAVAGFLLSLGLPAIQGNVSNGLFTIAWALPFFFGAVLGGILLDGIGRKFPMIVGLAIIGVSLAMLGIVGTQLSFISIVPLAIGFAIVSTASFIIWADLAPARARAVHYGVGFSLMAIALIVGLMGVGTVLGGVNPSQINTYLLVCSGTIFLCIPPLLQVEDALPKEIIEQRKMRQYLERAKRIYTKK